MNGLTAHQRTRAGLARSFQLPRPFATVTVADNLRVPLLYTVNARPGKSIAATSPVSTGAAARPPRSTRSAR